MKNTAILPTIICFIIVILSVAQLLVSNRLVTDGLLLTDLEREIDLTQQKSMILQEDITKNMALSEISSKAAELGFIKGGKTLSISVFTQIALHQ